MKFIGGLNKLNFADCKIKIPQYQRAAITFETGSAAYYFIRVLDDFPTKELIISSIDPRTWRYNRKVSITAYDAPGIVHSFVFALRENDININVEETLATANKGILTITLIVDLTDFKYNYREHAGSEAKRLTSALRALILNVEKIGTGDKILEQFGKVSITELSYLNSLAPIEKKDKEGVYELQIDCFEKHIQLVDKIQNYNLIEKLDLKKGTYYNIFADTEEKYIKILFFDPSQTLAFLNVYHENSIGSIAKITEIIGKGLVYNIIASYSYQNVNLQKQTAHWFGLIDISNDPKYFFTQTLDTLASATYSEGSSVKEVFLMESNAADIDEDVIMKYGQNKVTMDGEVTSIHLKKRNLLKQKIAAANISTYEMGQKFLLLLAPNVHKTKSLEILIKEIIDGTEPNLSRNLNLAQWKEKAELYKRQKDDFFLDNMRIIREKESLAIEYQSSKDKHLLDCLALKEQYQSDKNALENKIAIMKKNRRNNTFYLAIIMLVWICFCIFLMAFCQEKSWNFMAILMQKFNHSHNNLERIGEITYGILSTLLLYVFSNLAYRNRPRKNKT